MTNLNLTPTLKKLSILTIILCLFSYCFFAQNDQEGYVVQPNYEHPKFKELDSAFKKQKHRFEINRCEFKYNDQSFFIGDSYDKIIEIFGKPYKEPVFTYDKKSYSIKYKKLNLSLSFIPKINKLKALVIRMNNDYNFKILKFRKTPYHLDMTLNEFTKLCDLKHNETLGHNTTSFYIINEKNCKTKKNIKMRIESIPHFKTEGAGHMTIRGKFTPEKSDPITGFVISSKIN